ncbi:hypothetical protein L1887_45169 [Cichorium endivia]|nr:hypothetical protein L1887_45169 [Cichorium endivia]
MPRSSLISLPALFIPFSLLAAPEAVKVEVLQNKLDHPWSLAFLPDNKGLLVTPEGRSAQRWQAGKGLSDPIVGVPKVWANGQGGLLDVVLAPDFEKSRRIWLSFAEAGSDGKAGTAVGYGPPERRLFPHRGIPGGVPPGAETLHRETILAGRLVFDGKGSLFIGLGENNSVRRRRTWTSCRPKAEHVEGTEKPLFVWKVSPAVSGYGVLQQRRLSRSGKTSCLSRAEGKGRYRAERGGQ